MWPLRAHIQLVINKCNLVSQLGLLTGYSVEIPVFVYAGSYLAWTIIRGCLINTITPTFIAVLAVMGGGSDSSMLEHARHTLTCISTLLK